MFLQKEQKCISIIAFVLLILFTAGSILLCSGVFDMSSNIALADSLPIDNRLYLINTGYDSITDPDFYGQNMLIPKESNFGLLSTEDYTSIRDEYTFYFEMRFKYKKSDSTKRLLGNNIEGSITYAPVVSLDPNDTVRLTLPHANQSTSSTSYVFLNSSGTPFVLEENEYYYIEIMAYRFNENGVRLHIESQESESYIFIDYDKHFPTIYQGSPVIGATYQSWGVGTNNVCHIHPEMSIGGIVYPPNQGFSSRYIYEDTIVSDYAQAYQSGLLKGKEIGYNNGYTEGYNKGIVDGGTISYHNGLNDKQSTFDGLISVIESPFNMLRDIFSFEIFGINISAVVIFLLTAGVTVAVIKRFKG